MSSPLIRLALGLALGAALGLCYGFLRPLRPRLTALADLVFVVAVFYAWLELSFRICRADIRSGYTAMLPIGAILWDKTAGRLLRRPFQGFWKMVDGIFRLILCPFRKFFQKTVKISKKVFASGEKKGTIEKDRSKQKRTRGGTTHGAKKAQV